MINVVGAAARTRRMDAQNSPVCVLMGHDAAPADQHFLFIASRAHCNRLAKMEKTKENASPAANGVKMKNF